MRCARGGGVGVGVGVAVWGQLRAWDLEGARDPLFLHVAPGGIAWE